MDSTINQPEEYDHNIRDILDFLFTYQPPQLKQQHYDVIIQKFLQLDLPANYLLFSLVEKRLPHRAKMLFSGENYQGKRDTLLEVFAHLADLPKASLSFS